MKINEISNLIRSNYILLFFHIIKKNYFSLNIFSGLELGLEVSEDHTGENEIPSILISYILEKCCKLRASPHQHPSERRMVSTTPSGHWKIVSSCRRIVNAVAGLAPCMATLWLSIDFCACRTKRLLLKIKKKLPTARQDAVEMVQQVHNSMFWWIGEGDYRSTCGWEETRSKNVPCSTRFY